MYLGRAAERTVERVERTISRNPAPLLIMAAVLVAGGGAMFSTAFMDVRTARDWSSLAEGLFAIGLMASAALLLWRAADMNLRARRGQVVDHGNGA